MHRSSVLFRHVRGCGQDEGAGDRVGVRTRLTKDVVVVAGGDVAGGAAVVVYEDAGGVVAGCFDAPAESGDDVRMGRSGYARGIGNEGDARNTLAAVAIELQEVEEASDGQLRSFVQAGRSE